MKLDDYLTPIQAAKEIDVSLTRMYELMRIYKMPRHWITPRCSFLVRSDFEEFKKLDRPIGVKLSVMNKRRERNGNATGIDSR